MLFCTKKVYKKGLELDAQVYHLHDPELLPYALKLKKKGKKVIFDCHESYSDVFVEKPYLPNFIRPLIAKVFDAYFKRIAKKIDSVICCYHQTFDMVSPINKNTPLIFNFPIISNEHEEIEYQRGNKVCYCGELVQDFNHNVVIDAIKDIDVKYVFAGRDTEYIQNLLCSSTDYRGMVTFEEVKNIYKECQVGMCLLSYIKQCQYKVGNLSNNKFFEYMYAGLPIICTDFDLWSEIVHDYKCGICVNPYNKDEVKKAIIYLLNNYEDAKKMGENGRKAVIEKYNWNTEEKKLLDLYKTILND